jgi:hypothetical protein
MGNLTLAREPAVADVTARALRLSHADDVDEATAALHAWRDVDELTLEPDDLQLLALLRAREDQGAPAG